MLVFPTGRGSTVGSYVLYGMAKRGVAPAAIVCKEADPVVAVGAVMAGVPMVDRPERFEFKTGQRLRVKADEGVIEVLELRKSRSDPDPHHCTKRFEKPKSNHSKASGRRLGVGL